jgi:hypothetical protein
MPRELNLSEPYVGEPVTLDAGQTATVTAVRKDSIAVVLDGSATVVFVPRENYTPHGLNQLGRNIRTFMRQRNHAEARRRERHDTASIARPRQQGRARRPRRTVRTGRAKARAPASSKEPDPPLDLLDLAVLALGWGRVPCKCAALNGGGS